VLSPCRRGTALDVQAVRCRRRHQPRSPPLAKLQPPLKRVDRPVGPAWPRARDALSTFAVASICALLLDRRPPAVTRFNIAFIIDPSYQVLRRWPVTHIGEDGCKASAPSQANFDAATSIMLEPNIARVMAALHYGLPSFIFRRFRTQVAVGSVTCFGDQATATF
jgi:hypothetical protein